MREPGRRSTLYMSPVAQQRDMAPPAEPTEPAGSGGSRRASRGDGGALLVDMPQLDDEAERKRQQLEAAQASERRKSLSSIAGFNQSQLTAHHTNCMKLCTENKINTKNAFSLHLIDYMAQMLRQKKSDLDNFQVASYTLDASAKIYGCRVEVLHGDTLRMAGGLGRADTKQKPDGGPDNAEDEATGRRKKKVRRAATVERNLASITCRTGGGGGDAASAEPMLRRTLRAGGDDCRSAATFLGSLAVRDDSQELLADADCDAAERQPDSHRDDELPPPLVPPELGERRLCAPLHNFSFSAWSVDEERDGELPDRSPLFPRPPENQRHRFDATTGHDAIMEEEDAFDVMDEDDCDAGAGGPCGDGGHQQAGAAADSRVTVGRAGCLPAQPDTLLSMLSAVRQEYSYFDSRRMLTWAGPLHWKLRSLVTGRPPETAGGAKSRRKQKVQAMDYDRDVEWKKASAPSNRAIMLKEATLKKWSDERTTLPENLHYDIAALFKLFLRPGCVIGREADATTADSQVDLDGSVADFDYDNDRDTNDYCPGMTHSDGCDEYDQGATFLASDGAPGVWDASEIMSTTTMPSVADLTGDNLVLAPKKVERILISYARTAKKMDMRKLKAAVWDILVDKGRDNKENDVATPSDARHKQTDCTTITTMPPERNYSFRELYHWLPKRLSAKMSDNLSVALAFTALLHTANERCLRLVGARRLEDVLVSQEPA